MSKGSQNDQNDINGLYDYGKCREIKFSFMLLGRQNCFIYFTYTINIIPPDRRVKCMKYLDILSIQMYQNDRDYKMCCWLQSCYKCYILLVQYNCSQ